MLYLCPMTDYVISITIYDFALSLALSAGGGVKPDHIDRPYRPT